jgi:hypothetical protein
LLISNRDISILKRKLKFGPRLSRLERVEYLKNLVRELQAKNKSEGHMDTATWKENCAAWKRWTGIECTCPGDACIGDCMDDCCLHFLRSNPVCGLCKLRVTYRRISDVPACLECCRTGNADLYLSKEITSSVQ